MKLRKNAFTLIELLAVIVILAIIALIATPVILGIINNIKYEANKRSVELYAASIKNAIVRYQLKENEQTIKFEDIEEYIEYDGGNVSCQIIKIYEDGNIYLNGCIVNNNSKGYVYGTQHLTKENVKATTETTKTTGKVPVIDEDGNIIPGSEFQIKVNDTSGWLTFFVLSNDDNYVNLIAEKNITLTGQYTSELEDNDEWYVASSDLYNNRYGPQTAYTYLSNATNNWTNIPIIESFDYLDEGNQSKSTYGYQSIVTKLDELTGKYITTIIPYSSDYGNPVTYENIRVRLPKYSEVVSTEVGCDSSSGSCPLWMVNYLFDDSDSEIYYNESNGKVNGKGKGYWLLSSSTVNSNYARIVYYPGRVINYNNNYAYYGVRPVIKILKSDLFRVMK